MKLPSLQYIYEEASQSFKRFPMTLLAAFLGAVFLIFMIEVVKNPEDYPNLVHLILICSLAIPLTFSVQMLIEKQGCKGATNYLLYAGSIVLLLAYYFTFPPHLDDFLQYARYLLLSLALHFLVAFIPFINKGEINGFWQYNKGLFIRFLTAILFSYVLLFGIFFAFFCISSLLEIDIDEKRYMETAVIIFAIFNTWFFLAGIPDNIANLESKKDYPKGLKVFAQYILLPLVLLYLGILYCYVGKISMAGEWPKGIISYLILGVSVTGILALLLLHPLTIQDKNSWVAKASKIYYILLVPLSFVLALAVWRRVSEYNITENRYLLILLTIWLLVMTVYFVFSKVKNIKVIPISLFAFTLFAAVIPYFNVFSFSKKQQINRLENLLTENGLLKNGLVQKVSNSEKLPRKAIKEIRNITDYLGNRNYLADLNHLFKEKLDTILIHESQYGKKEVILNLLGVKEIAENRGRSNAYHRNSTNHPRNVDIKGFDVFVPISFYFDRSYKAVIDIELANENYTLTANDTHNLILQKGDSTLLELPLDKYLAQVEAINNKNRDSNGFSTRLTPEEMTFTKTKNDLKTKLLINNMQVSSKAKPANQMDIGNNKTYDLYLRSINATLLIAKTE